MRIQSNKFAQYLLLHPVGAESLNLLLEEFYDGMDLNITERISIGPRLILIREEEYELLLVSEFVPLKCPQFLVLLIVDQFLNDILEGDYADHLQLGIPVLYDLDLSHNGHV